MKGDHHEIGSATLVWLPIPAGIPVELRAVMKSGWLTFSYRLEGGEWQKLETEIDGSFLSDEACAEGWFTGAMAGKLMSDTSWQIKGV